MTAANLPGGYLDPDGWVERWRSRHHSQLIDGEVARFALARLGEGAEGVGQRELRFFDPKLDEAFMARVDYIIEDHEGRGLIFFLLALTSPGDPERSM